MPAYCEERLVGARQTYGLKIIINTYKYEKQNMAYNAFNSSSDGVAGEL